MDLLLQRTPRKRTLLGVPENPDVKFAKLPFYECVEELMQPKPLVTEWFCDSQTKYFKFRLSPPQSRTIQANRTLQKDAIVECEYTMQIQIRVCELDTRREQEDRFPQNMCVHVNGIRVSLPGRQHPREEGTQPFGSPLDITSLCHLSAVHTVSNQIKISWEDDQGYCVSVFLVKKASLNAVLGRLKQTDADNTKTLIKQMLTSDPECEIITTGLRISLICPLSMKRMVIPIRTDRCTHLQCFDAITFLQMNTEKSVWRCPICKKLASLNQLVIDGLLDEILKKATDIDEIQFNIDGTWRSFKPPEKPVAASCGSAKRKFGVEDLRASPLSLDNGPLPKKVKEEVIDLTLSSGEESSDEEWMQCLIDPFDYLLYQRKTKEH